MSVAVVARALDRRKLSRSPLVNAIWQLKFTSEVGLRDGRAVVAFQASLKHQTSLAPVQSEGSALQFSIGQGIPGAGVATDQQAWRLSGEDGHAAITLAPGVVTLETSLYGSWDENFDDWIQDITAALATALNPGLTTRIGLRYVNVVFGKALEREPLEGAADFAGVVHPALLGFAGEAPDFEAVMVQGRQVLSIGDVTVNLNHALVRAESAEAGMLIDVDSYLEKATAFDADEVGRHTEELHDIGLSVFQRCVTPEAWDAMGPIDVEGGERIDG